MAHGGWITAQDECEAGSFPRDTVEYDAVIPYKRRLLKSAWANFSAGGRRDLRAGYEQFRDDQAHWLEDYALFRALKAKFSGEYCWYQPSNPTLSSCLPLTQVRESARRKPLSIV